MGFVVPPPQGCLGSMGLTTSGPSAPLRTAVQPIWTTSSSTPRQSRSRSRVTQAGCEARGREKEGVSERGAKADETHAAPPSKLGNLWSLFNFFPFHLHKRLHLSDLVRSLVAALDCISQWPTSTCSSCHNEVHFCTKTDRH